MYIINFNKLTIYFNLIILFLISFYLINDFFKSKTSVKEKKNSEQKTHTNFSETNYKIQKDLSLININLPKLQKRNFSHFSILYRTNAQSRSLEESLRRTGIPYNLVGSVRFYDRKEVKDALGYLKLVINLLDTISLRRIINFPPRGIGMKTMDKCVVKSEEDNISLFEVLKNSKQLAIRGKQSDSLVTFYNLIKKYNGLQKKLNASELSRSLIEESGIIKYYKESQEVENKDRYENIIELLNSIDEFCMANPGSNLSDFLEEVSLLTDIDNWNDSENRVTLMTVHSSKGLEFPIVFVAGFHGFIVTLKK